MSPPPKGWVTTKAAIWQGGRLLLLREDPGDGEIVHDLPGGRLDPGEDPHEALRRELREEIGVEATTIAPLPEKVWSTVTKEGVGVVGLLYRVTLASFEFDHSRAAEVVGAEFLTAAEFAQCRDFVHKPFIEEILAAEAGESART